MTAGVKQQFKGWGVIAIVALVLVITALFFRITFPSTSALSIAKSRYKKIAVIELSGAILDSEKILGRIRQLDDARGISGVILQVDSPGGAVGPSQEIYEALDIMRSKHGWKIYATLSTVAASGGYWVALVADKIYANPGTLTGSIGVIMELLNLEELMGWMKVKRHTFKAGKFKDIGNANRPITEQERRLLQGILDDIHAQFRERVMERRGLSEDDMKDIAQGQVFSGRQAYEVGLIDKLGGFERVVQDMIADLGLPEDTDLYYPQPARAWSEWVEHFGSSAMENIMENLISPLLEMARTPVIK